MPQSRHAPTTRVATPPSYQQQQYTPVKVYQSPTLLQQRQQQAVRRQV